MLEHHSAKLNFVLFFSQDTALTQRYILHGVDATYSLYSTDNTDSSHN